MTDKKQLLVETALVLFYQNGINNIGINEVLKVSRVAKKTLYAHFSSKEALILAALELRDKRFLEWLESALGHPNSNAELAQRLFCALDNWFNNRVDTLSPFRGCFFINTSAEFSDPDSEISQYCLRHKQAVEAVIKAAMPEHDEALLKTLCLLKEGAIVSAYVGRDLTAAKHAQSLF